jgi:predicted transcriptional regulator YheO
MQADDEHDLLMREASKIAAALAETFAPICEVVLHDLRHPDCAITQIENNLSGRKVGGPATELGLARIADPEFPDVLVNYPNTFSDGRPVKSTSIGLKDSEGKFVAALCINIDISYLNSIVSYIEGFTRTSRPDVSVSESFAKPATETIPNIIYSFAASRNKDPRALSSDERRALVTQLAEQGLLERRGAADQIAKLIGASRSSIYYYMQPSASK